MGPEAERVLAAALDLPLDGRAELVERLVESLSVDAMWEVEAEARIEAYERGELKSFPAAELFACLWRGRIG